MAIMNFERLTICSNTIIGGGQLLTIDGVTPLTIVNGITHPVVTIISSSNLSSPTPIWNTYVIQNKANHPAIRVEIDHNNHRVSVRASETIVLEARMDGQTACVVGALDLRPLGLVIFGDANSLTASGNRYSMNLVQRVPFMLSLNTKNPFAMQ